GKDGVKGEKGTPGLPGPPGPGAFPAAPLPFNEETAFNYTDSPVVPLPGPPGIPIKILEFFCFDRQGGKGEKGLKGEKVRNFINL
ncbi:hypothetical protein chiPu_0023385, partial [Chiloscyllium punctatum]|nr:hypothetical protein [Chiloscyllium punctatum]